MTNPETGSAHKALGIDQIAAALAARARTPLGREIASAAGMAPDVESAERLLDQTGAMVGLMENRPDFDIDPCEDVTGLLVRARKAVTLGGAQLRSFAPVLRTGARLAMIFSGEEEAGAAEALGVDLPLVTGLAELIEESIDEEGNVRPDATPRIESLHASVNSLKRSIAQRAEKMLDDPKIAPELQDKYVTLRDNRFVLPIRAESKTKIDGILHDSSNSGQTFYIEPKELVDMNNRLRTAEMELADEIEKLLRDISAMVAGEADEIEKIYREVCRLDAIAARARLVRDLGLVRPGFGGALNLLSATHPLMLLDRKKAVPNDISMPEGARALIISGPNTGGKTVALAIVGLSAVMAKMGLFVAAAEGSTVPFYEDIHADIGDSQSISDDLSTFSGHLRTITEIVDRAGPGSLALLDELMINTDPKEGGALAMAVVDRLTGRGAHVVVTTHFHELKIMAQTSDTCANVSMEFDRAEGRPTYRMIRGVPGESSAIAIAEKLNLDREIVALAKAHLEGGDERIERTLTELRDQKAALEAERREAGAALAEAEALRKQARAARDELEAARKEAARSVKRKVSGEIAAARRAIREIMDEAKKEKGSREALKQKLEKMERIAADVREAGAPEEKVPRDRLKAGDEVYVTALDSKGVLSADPAGGKAEVAMGSARLTVNLTDLIGIGGKGIAPQAKKGRTAFKPAATYTAEVVGAEIKLIGMRVEEALEKLEKFMDAAYGSGAERIRVIHGKGTGALRSAVREYLASSPYVEDFAAEGPEKGGDGATVVSFRRT